MYVQFVANDILAFVTLYSEASVLFFLITAILLTARLGSIILATSSAAPEITKQNAPGLLVATTVIHV